MKALDRWAREAGYSDFDTYVRTGGSFADVRRDIAKRIQALHDAMTQIEHRISPDTPRAAPATLAEADLAAASKFAAHEDEPPDPDNAQIQGADYLPDPLGRHGKP